MPALNASPRSTRGTTRTIAYSNGLRPSRPAGSRGSGTVSLLDERSRILEPRQEIVHVGAAMGRRVGETGLGLEPVVGDRVCEALERGPVQHRIEPANGSRTWSRAWGNGRRA